MWTGHVDRVYFNLCTCTQYLHEFMRLCEHHAILCNIVVVAQVVLALPCVYC